jgi:nucleoside-diphosphate-sugar epimerase
LIGTRKISKVTKSVLVTGASGFIGSHLLEVLQYDQNFTVTTTSLNKKPKVDNSHFFVNLLNQDDTIKLIRAVRPKILVHLAWIATPNVYANSDTNEEWLSSTKCLFDTFLECGGQRIIVAGSCAEYEQNHDAIALTEDALLSKATKFSVAKNELFEYVNHLTSRHNFSFAWLRFFYLFGDGEPSAKLYSKIVDSCRNAEKLDIRSPDSLIDFIHIKDAVFFIYRSLQITQSFVCNIGTGKGIRVRSLLDSVKDFLPQNFEVTYGHEEGTNLVSNNSRLKSIFGDFSFIRIENELAKAIKDL